LTKQRKIRDQATALVFKTLAEAEEPLNKYQLGKATKLSKPMLYEIVDMLETSPLKMIEVARSVKAKAPRRKSKQYRLTSHGLFYAAYLNPELRGMIRERLGSGPYKKMREGYRKGAVGNLEWELDNIILPTIRRLIAVGKGPSNSKWILTIETDSLGRIKWLWNEDLPDLSIEEIPGQELVGRIIITEYSAQGKPKKKSFV